jgi:hypothetical protein
MAQRQVALSRVIKGYAMSAFDEYRAYARDCLRWAAKARTEEQRKRLLSLAKDWTQAAEGLEGLYSPSDLDCASVGSHK